MKRNPGKYVKINYAFDLPRVLPDDYEKVRKLCTMIAGNKSCRVEGELYSKRREVIDWFENNGSNDFDFYGVGWDHFAFNSDGKFRYLNKFNIVRRAFAKNYKNYRGSVERKRDVLENYTFVFCFENVSHPTGYITEKIFDAFFSGCIPVYLGAKNIKDHIPIDCYIDGSGFDNIADMYDFIKNMDNCEITGRKTMIRNFIGSDLSYEFSIDKFIDTILKNIFC